MGTLSNPLLSELLVNVRLLLNQPNASNSNWTDAELTVYLNEAIRINFAELTKINEGHFLTVTDLNVTANQETVPLPSDFFAIRALYKKSNEVYIILPYRNNMTEGYSTQGGGGTDTYFPSYYIRGDNLVLRPVPNFTETASMRLEYIQFPSTLVTGTDALTDQITPVFKQVIEMYAVYKAKMKESLVTGVNTFAIAKDNLHDLESQFADVIALRSKNPTSVIPFNPEGEF